MTNECNESGALAIAADLARGASLPPPRAALRLQGGRNNRVFRVALADGRFAALKIYHHDPRDPRDRLAAEWSFIAYARGRGIRAVPEPLACDPQRHAALYGFVPGNRLSQGEVGEHEIAAALEFVSALNAAPHTAELIGRASEACFSLHEHVQTVERRIERLAALDSAMPRHHEAEVLVTERLQPAFLLWREGLAARASAIGFDLAAPIKKSEVCLSPSDFGFHNALRNADGNLTFLDFEYAGFDDPAKLVCDFFCQPEVPVPLDLYPRFADGVIRALGVAPTHRARFDLLLDLYRLKWVCIILNDFLPVDTMRRSFALPEEREARCIRQIGKAQAELDLLSFERERGRPL